MGEDWEIVSYPQAGWDDNCVATGAVGRQSVVAPVVIVAYNRPDYLNQTLTSVLARWPQSPDTALKYPLFVSVDGEDKAVRKVALWHAQRVHGAIRIIQHRLYNSDNGYARLAQHYRYLLKFFFKCMQYPRLIFLEDDLEIGADFFDYFERLVPVLEGSKQLWCVSAWNDHAVTKAEYDPLRLYRTDFMPGLGWMLRNDTGLDLAGKWPHAYWDDWMRLRHVRSGRQCVFPELPRTHTFGKVGTSGGQFWDQYLSRMPINDKKLDWKAQDLTYLADDRYPAHFAERACAASPLSLSAALPDSGAHRVTYGHEGEYRQFLDRIGSLSEWREGIPRMAYQDKHVVVLHKQARVFVVYGPALDCSKAGKG